VLAPSLIPFPSLKITVQQNDSAISLVLSVLWSSTIMRLLTALEGITLLIRFNTSGNVSAPFLVHITKSTLPSNFIPKEFYLSIK
jgi:hypothetical protein